MNQRLDARISKWLTERGEVDTYFLFQVEPLDSLEDLFYKNLSDHVVF